MILNQILSTILKTNVWRSVGRICIWISGLKGLISVPGAFAAYTKIIHRNGGNQNTKKKNDRTCFGKGTEQNRKLIEKKKNA